MRLLQKVCIKCEHIRGYKDNKTGKDRLPEGGDKVVGVTSTFCPDCANKRKKDHKK